MIYPIMVTPEQIQAIRFEIQDTEEGLYILDSSTIEYYIQKNHGSINKASLDCARAILMRLSMNASDEVVDVLSIKGSRSAEAYRLALQMYLSNPHLNPVLNNCVGYVGGVSKSEMQANENHPDNNFVRSPSKEYSNGYRGMWPPPDNAYTFDYFGV